ncbi:MAG TPA: response regulator [Armatimonadota bacterium]|jgi:CheY-like chemotaxis protein
MARILVVDDEANIRMMIRIALQADGHVVEQAADGPEGLEKFDDGSDWDLVLLDQRMPGMEGLEVLREMRRLDPGARIVMVTAYGTSGLAIEAMKEGSTDFLRKPFTLEMLRGAVQAATSGAAGATDGEGPVISFTTLNGFRIEPGRQPGATEGNDLVYHFTVHGPGGETTACTVSLPAHVLELVIAHAGREQMPGGDLFWQGFCEEALANYVWQNACPPEERLRVEELTKELRRWVDSALASPTGEGHWQSGGDAKGAGAGSESRVPAPDSRPSTG